MTAADADAIARREDELEIGLAVAAFNSRAISVYERAGFRAVERYEHATGGGVHPFIRMER